MVVEGLNDRYVKTFANGGACVAQSVERVPYNGGCESFAAAVGLTPTCRPLMRVIPPLSLPISYICVIWVNWPFESLP